MEQSLAEVDVTPVFRHAGARHAATRAAAPAVRYNLYVSPHKALRLGLSNALAAAGRVDPHDDAEIAALGGQVQELLQFCRTHLDKEEHFVHPAMEARRPGSSSGTRNDHRDHLAAFAALESGVQAVATAKGELREVAVDRLYRQLALFVADNLVHMHAEETENNEVLWDAYSDHELHELEQRLVASIPPDMKQMALRWIVPAMNPAERASFLLEMRTQVPAMAFEAALAD